MNDSISKAQNMKRSWMKSCNSTYAIEKLIRILNGQVYIPQQHWGINRIFATLVAHRNEPRLSIAYWKFKQLSYQTMLIETDKSSGRWPGALTRKDIDLILKLRLQDEIQKRYGKEVQTLCKTSAFGIVTNSCPGEIDWRPLENIINDARTKAPLLSSLVVSVGPSSSSSTHSHLISMKIVAILVILCRSTHQNNSNYIPFLIALYLYSAGARVDAITLLNHLGLSVSYDVLQRKLKDITTSSIAWIKAQGSNCKLVGTWDNFEFRENVYGKRVGDIVKFRSVTMALWIQQGWQIPNLGLKQWMWDQKREVLQPSLVDISVFGQAALAIRKETQQSHRFGAFRAAFPNQQFSHYPAMPIINWINCKTEGCTKAYPFAPSMFSESSTAGNLSVFEDLNIVQMGLDKSDTRWDDWLTLW